MKKKHILPFGADTERVPKVVACYPSGCRVFISVMYSRVGCYTVGIATGLNAGFNERFGIVLKQRKFGLQYKLRLYFSMLATLFIMSKAENSPNRNYAKLP